MNLNRKTNGWYIRGILYSLLAAFSTVAAGVFFYGTVVFPLANRVSSGAVFVSAFVGLLVLIASLEAMFFFLGMSIHIYEEWQKKGEPKDEASGHRPGPSTPAK